MKKVLTLFLVVSFSFFGFSQSTENIDYISPFQNGLATVKKDGLWAFINTQGEIIVDYRNDLVITKSDDGNFPIFKNDRCLIEEKREGISYFGYINTCGKTVIQPKFINASNFNDGLAIVLELFKEQVARNEALGKNVVYDKYLHGVIDSQGNIKAYLSPKRVNIILDKKFLKEPPKIMAKYMSNNLYAVRNNNQKWTIVYVNELDSVN